MTIPKGQAVQVKLSTDFTATSGEGKNAATLKYKVKKGNDEVANEGAVLTVTSGSGSTDLTFELAEKVTYSGTYTDTVKFIVSVGLISRYRKCLAFIFIYGYGVRTDFTVFGLNNCNFICYIA